MDPFATLGIERRFDVDLSDAEKKHRELSRALHPDKFVGAPPSEKRAALNKAVEVNEAWRAVRDPIRRAEALFQLAGVPVGETNEPKPSPVFLMDMMEQREALAEAKAMKDLAAVRGLAEAVADRANATELALTEGFRANADLSSLVKRLGELRFYRRFLEEVSSIEDDLANQAAHP